MVSISEAKAQLSRLIDRVEAGEELVITRRGRAVARLTPILAPKRKMRSLAKFRARMPGWGRSSAELLRELRDAELPTAAGIRPSR